MTRLLRLSLVASALLLSTGGLSRAGAQCSAQCNPADEHWPMPGIPTHARIGMVEVSSGLWRPALCYLSNGVSDI